MGKHSTRTIVRTTLFALAGLGAAGSLSVALFAGGQTKGHPMMGHKMSTAGTMTKEQKIANAVTAAPTSVLGKATILDWPAKEGEAPSVLRAGTNGWNCLPDMAETEGNDPMCVDQSWMQWVEAYMTHTAPHVTSVGIGYMIAPGGAWGSNTDPYAMTVTPDNQWHMAAPHVMIVVPDPKTLEGISTDPNNGGPYVMYAGTPYAHLMAPVATPGMKPATSAR